MPRSLIIFAFRADIIFFHCPYKPMPIACMQAACAAGEPAEDPYEGLASCVARMKANRAGPEQLRAGQLKADELIKEFSTLHGNQVRQIASFWVAL